MANTQSNQKRSPVRRWIRRGFIAWAVVSTLWLFNSYRTQGVADTLLTTDARVTVQSSPDALAFLPNPAVGPSGLLFIVGAGVSAEAYAPLLRPIAEKGYRVFVVRLPWRIAPLEQHKKAALTRVHAILGDNDQARDWVVAGHSLGGALACRIAAESPPSVRAMVLIGTSHPKTTDLSQSRMPITKVYASNDGVATVEMINATRHLLPGHTRWIEIEGGNHSQFGHYGHQLFDGSPTISRERQQDVTRSALLDALEHAGRQDGAIPGRYRELIALAVACTTQSPYCIDAHAKAVKSAGATPEEVVESAFLAAALRAGGAATHGAMALKFFDRQ